MSSPGMATWNGTGSAYTDQERNLNLSLMKITVAKKSRARAPTIRNVWDLVCLSKKIWETTRNMTTKGTLCWVSGFRQWTHAGTNKPAMLLPWFVLFTKPFVGPVIQRCIDRYSAGFEWIIMVHGFTIKDSQTTSERINEEKAMATVRLLWCTG